MLLFKNLLAGDVSQSKHKNACIDTSFKASNTRALRSCRGGLTLKIDKNSTDLQCFKFPFGGAWSFV